MNAFVHVRGKEGLPLVNGTGLGPHGNGNRRHNGNHNENNVLQLKKLFAVCLIESHTKNFIKGIQFYDRPIHCELLPKKCGNSYQTRDLENAALGKNTRASLY